jgi:hypothetical protein
LLKKKSGEGCCSVKLLVPTAGRRKRFTQGRRELVVAQMPRYTGGFNH